MQGSGSLPHVPQVEEFGAGLDPRAERAKPLRGWILACGALLFTCTLQAEPPRPETFELSRDARDEACGDKCRCQPGHEHPGLLRDFMKRYRLVYG